MKHIITALQLLPFVALAAWLIYAVGMGLANDICDCI